MTVNDTSNGANTMTIATTIATAADNEAINPADVVRLPSIAKKYGINLLTVTDLDIRRANRILRDSINRTLGIDKDRTEEAKPVKPAPKRGKIVRGKIFGHSLASVLRWMGSKGWNFEDAAVVMATMGFGAINDCTITKQLKAGRDGKPGAPITDSQARTLVLNSK